MIVESRGPYRVTGFHDPHHACGTVPAGYARGETATAGSAITPRVSGVTRPGEPPPAARPLLRDVLGLVLRRTRTRQGRTLAAVAQRARVSTQYLSEVERGRKEASSEVLAAICAALDVALPDLLMAAGRELSTTGRMSTLTRHTAASGVAPVLRLADAAERRGRRRRSRGPGGDVRLRLAA